MLAQAVRADAVAEVGLGVVRDVGLHLLPVTLIIPDSFAGSAHREHAAQGLDLGQRILKLGDQPFTLFLRSRDL